MNATVARIMQATDTATGKEVSVTRLTIPFILTLSVVVFIVVVAFSAGAIFTGWTRDKEATETRLTAIEKELTAIKTILGERQLVRTRDMQASADAEPRPRKRR